MSSEQENDYFEKIMEGKAKNPISNQTIERIKNINLDLSTNVVENKEKEVAFKKVLPTIKALLATKAGIFNDDELTIKKYQLQLIESLASVDLEDSVKTDIIDYGNQILGMTEEEAKAAIEQICDVYGYETSDVFTSKSIPRK